MRDDELRGFLRQVNPWWRAAAASGDATAWTASDRALRSRAAYDLGYRASVLADVARDPEAAVAVRRLEPFTEDLDLAWQRYLECGGFPRAVAEHSRDGAVSVSFCRDLLAWLRADVDPEAPAESLPLLLDAVQTRTGAPLNVRRTAESQGLTRSYLDRRLARLVSAFAAIWCPQRDDAGRVIPGSQAKLYLTDPLLGQLPVAARPGLPVRDGTRSTEAALGVALASAIDAASPGRWTDGDTIGCARTGQGNEVDFAPVPVAVAHGSGERWTTPVEAKWVSTGWRAEARVVEGRYGRGVVATKDVVWHDTPAWAIPAPASPVIMRSRTTIVPGPVRDRMITPVGWVDHACRLVGGCQVCLAFTRG